MVSSGSISKEEFCMACKTLNKYVGHDEIEDVSTPTLFAHLSSAMADFCAAPIVGAMEGKTDANRNLKVSRIEKNLKQTIF